MDICPYCSNTYLQISEEHDEEKDVSTIYSLCVLCGWACTQVEVIPDAEHLEQVQKWRELVWYSVVDNQGERLNPWDFEDVEAAEAVACALQGEVITWTLQEDWDGVTLPNPYSAYLLTLQEEEDE